MSHVENTKVNDDNLSGNKVEQDSRPLDQGPGVESTESRPDSLESLGLLPLPNKATRSLAALLFLGLTREPGRDGPDRQSTRTYHP